MGNGEYRSTGECTVMQLVNAIDLLEARRSIIDRLSDGHGNGLDELETK